jgi:hypothetical protein
MTYEAVRKHELGHDFETEVTAALRAVMDWIYRQLEDEYGLHHRRTYRSPTFPPVG